MNMSEEYPEIIIYYSEKIIVKLKQIRKGEDWEYAYRKVKNELALEVIRRLKQAYPDAACSLDYNEAWKLLVSVRLAAQCTDARVNMIVPKLYVKISGCQCSGRCTRGRNRRNRASPAVSAKSQSQRYQRLHADAEGCL